HCRLHLGPTRFVSSFSFFYPPPTHRALRSFPTRRSSDLEVEALYCAGPAGGAGLRRHITPRLLSASCLIERDLVTPAVSLLRSTDRKSTRLNSSHVKISYAVFCLKKKRSESHVVHARLRY